MWKATIRGIVAHRVRLALDGARGAARRHVRQRHLRAHRHARHGPSTGCSPRPSPTSTSWCGARGDDSGTGSTCSGSPRRRSTTCGRSPGVRPGRRVRARLRAVRRPGRRRHRHRRAADPRDLVGRSRATGPFRLVDDGDEPCAARRPTRSRWTPAPRARTASRSATTCGCCCRGRRRASGSSACSASATESDFGALTFAAFDLATAQQAFARRGRARRDQRASRARRPTSSMLRGADRDASSARPTTSSSPRDAARRQRQAGPRLPRRCSPSALLGFAAIGVVVARVHHLQHLHDPRRAAHARARAAAGDGRERAGGESVVLEALVVGLVASAIGLRARDLRRRRAARAAARDRASTSPKARRCCEARTVVVALGVGVVVTVGRGAVPAMRAARDAAGRRHRRRAAGRRRGRSPCGPAIGSR